MFCGRNIAGSDTLFLHQFLRPIVWHSTDKYVWDIQKKYRNYYWLLKGNHWVDPKGYNLL